MAAPKMKIDARAVFAGPIGGFVRFLGPNQTAKNQTFKWNVLYSGKASGGPNSVAQAKLVMGTASTPEEVQLWSGEDRNFDTYNLTGSGEVYLNPGMEMMLKYTFSNSSAEAQHVTFEVVEA